MAIKLLSPEIAPAVVYDQVLLSRLEIEQTADPASDAVFAVTVEFSRYGVVNGTKVRAPAHEEVHIKDYVARAKAAALAGDTRLLVAFAAIESAIAVILCDEGIEASPTQGGA